jgi:hypothetical protein
MKYSNEILVVNQWQGLEIPGGGEGGLFADGDAVIEYHGFDKVHNWVGIQ